MNNYICKIKEESIIRKAIALLNYSCNEYKDLKYEDIEDCYNSIYVIKDDLYNWMDGFIACKREYQDNSILIKYHPKKNNSIYKIECLHWIEFLPIELKKGLIECCLKDKNDSFVIIEVVCPQIMKDINILKDLGFEQYMSNMENNNKYIFVKPPKVY